MNAPILTFRITTSPYNAISTALVYYETVATEKSLPTLSGDDSDKLYFRIYNNYGMASNIAFALNIYLTTFDGVGVHTASTPPVSQQWIHFYEDGWGESAGAPALFTSYSDVDLAVGGSANTKVPTYGSDGSSNPYIRAGTNGNGVGFIEWTSYAQVPLGVVGYPTYNFSILLGYEWTS